MKTTTIGKTRKEKEPTTDCPVCKAETKVSELEGKTMCFHCATYLEHGGTDHGLFMIRIETRDKGLRRAFLRPRGFWSDAVEVHETEDYWKTHETGKLAIKSEVRWSCGGTDGTVDEIRTAENFARAMDHAVMLAKIWKMERQEGKEA